MHAYVQFMGMEDESRDNLCTAAEFKMLVSDSTAYLGMESENEAQLTGKQAWGTLQDKDPKRKEAKPYA